MGPRDRRSISRPTQLSGIGLHTGAPATVRLCPAAAGQGIRFVRCDLPGRPEIPASVDQVVETDRRTVLATPRASVDTVEHLLAAVVAHDLDDLIVELDGPEPPILDGSAEPYHAAIASAGTAAVGGHKTRYVVPRPVALEVGPSSYRAVPGRAPRITVTVHWDHPLIGTQSVSCEAAPAAVARELAAARTFGFVREVEAMRARGLIRGASAACAVVLTDTGLLSGRLRWPDEFARHKALDLVGDLALLGGRFQGEIIADRPTHTGNVALARLLKRNGTTEP